jgi:hypothetical protein
MPAGAKNGIEVDVRFRHVAAARHSRHACNNCHDRLFLPAPGPPARSSLTVGPACNLQKSCPRHDLGVLLVNISNLMPPRSRLHGAGIACCLLLAACASPSIGNAPPAVVDECRREVAALTDRDRLPPLDESLPDDAGPEGTTIDEARTAQAELEGSSLAAWPEDALLYRCFPSRGIVLTEEQATVLAEWQSRTDDTATPENL